MVRAKSKIGIFLTDASFDFKTKVASISIINLKENKNFNIHNVIKNPKEAETLGIYEALKKGINKYENIIIFCDNLYSVNEVRKTVLNSKYWKSKFKYIQIVWVPREETHLADFFSKNLSEGSDNLKKKIESFENECITSNVMDLVVTIKDKEKIILKFKKEALLKNPELIKFNFQSIVLNKLFHENKVDLELIDNHELDFMRNDYINLLYDNPEYNKNNSLKKIVSGFINFF